MGKELDQSERNYRLEAMGLFVTMDDVGTDVIDAEDAYKKIQSLQSLQSELKGHQLAIDQYDKVVSEYKSKIAQLEKENDKNRILLNSAMSTAHRRGLQLQPYKELNKALTFYHEHSSCIFCNGTKISQAPPDEEGEPCEICAQLEQLLK